MKQIDCTRWQMLNMAKKANKCALWLIYVGRDAGMDGGTEGRTDRRTERQCLFKTSSEMEIGNAILSEGHTLIA